LLEKTLTALTAVEMSLITHKQDLTKKVIDSIEKANKPLIDEVRYVIKEMNK
jgi:hypothetical protein